jgi:hypothetical protein
MENFFLLRNLCRKTRTKKNRRKNKINYENMITMIIIMITSVNTRVPT